MTDLFQQYWWLLFPIMGFAFGGFGMWLNYRRSRDALDLIKTYAAQGKEPPEALIRAVSGEEWSGGLARSERRAARHEYRWGPYGELRRVIIFGGLALGFGLGAWWSGDENVRLAFGVVAIVMGFVGIGSLIIAVLQFSNRPDK